MWGRMQSTNVMVYVHPRNQKISRHNVTGESACGDIDDENDGIHML